MFQSGVSLGSGLTLTTKSYSSGDYIFVDTPGLDDEQRRESAAREISLAFRAPAQVKVVFVTTLEGGRIRPADMCTFEVVLTALEKNGIDVANKFSVIINKCEPRVVSELNGNKSYELMACLNFVKPVSHVLALKFEEKAYGEENVMLAWTKNLSKFVDDAPVLEIPPIANVFVDVAAHDKKVEAMNAEITQLLAAIQKRGKKVSGGSNSETAPSKREDEEDSKSHGSSSTASLSVKIADFLARFTPALVAIATF